MLATFCCFQGFSKNHWWHYVALCGAMWRYPVIWKNDDFLYFCYFLLFPGIFKKSVVALCGAMWRYPVVWKKRWFPLFLLLFAVSRDFQENSGGAMWRYPVFWKNDDFLNVCCFAVSRNFQENSGGTVWRYPRNRKKTSFPNSWYLQDISQNSCGLMWPYVSYVALSLNLNKICSHLL